MSKRRGGDEVTELVQGSCREKWATERRNVWDGWNAIQTRGTMDTAGLDGSLDEQRRVSPRKLRTRSQREGGQESRVR